MGSLNNLQRLRVEDFPEQYQDLMSKLSSTFNPILDQLQIIFNKSIDFKNLNMQINTITVSVDSSGSLIQPTSISSSLKTKCMGITVIRCLNQGGSATQFDSAPFVSFTESSSVLTLNNIKGLNDGQTYSLTVLCVGDNI